MNFRFFIPVVFYANDSGWVRQNTNIVNRIYWLDMTTCFGRTWPSSGRKLFFNLTILNRKHIHEKGLFRVSVYSWCQIDLVVSRILLYILVKAV